MSDTLEHSLRQIEQHKSGNYEVRTRHRDEHGRPRFVNRLIREDSPYLLQHAHNPVNWFGWGEEAFVEAVRGERPIFLSIGYSTCHWCHVMEAESFDNVEIAQLLNRDFISIKLDREQFPDVDEFYMTGTQLISGQGGWPMSNFLLPDGRPFYAATYFPPAQFAALLQRVAQLWREQRPELEASAERAAAGITEVLRGRQEVRELDLESITLAADRMLEREDRHHGGLAGAPKFPQEPLLLYFLDGAARQRDLRKMEFLDRALTGMGCGGIYDQVGGGFHRYSTDAQWLVPHFEKMLYNQSQLTLVYLTAWRLTANPFYRRIVRQTLDYVLREMQLPDGGFYSATDADSEDQEGLYFIWTPEQLSELLQPRELELVKRLYGPTAEGNFEGANILALQSAMDSYQQDGSFQDLEAQLDPLLNKLLDARQQRIAPLRDDKLIVAWAAAMAGSLARAGWELGERGYLEAAERAVQAMLADNYPARRELRRIFLNGETSVAAQLEDYANLCEALLTLFDCTGKFPYLARAADLMDDMVVLFWNDEHGGFFLGPAHGSGPELTRSCSAADGATLSSYAVATQCLALLLERRAILEFRQHDSRLDYERLFQQSVSAASSQLDEFPPSHVTLLRALQHQSQGSILPIRYAGQGVVRISSRRATPEAGGDNDRGGRHRVVFNIASLPGFHVTGEVAESAGGAPLQLQLDDEEQHWQLGTPVMETQSVTDASGEEVFNGERIEMLVDLVAEDTEVDGLAASAGLQLAVQPCSDSVCLAPQQFRFRL